MAHDSHHRSFIRRAVTATALTSVAVLAWVIPSEAAVKDSSPFSVLINLNTGATGGTPNTGYCRTRSGIGVFGSTLTVVCATGTVVSYSGNISNLPWVTTIQDDSFRYLLSVYNATGESLGIVDSFTGIGTVTTWRTFRFDHQDYLEMMVHW